VACFSEAVTNLPKEAPHEQASTHRAARRKRSSPRNRRSGSSQLPPEHRLKIDAVLARVIDSTKRRRRILSLVQDALGQLRLDMKYLAFDLEATRRERDEYRRKLE
jgi:hypothetical protein